MDTSNEPLLGNESFADDASFDSIEEKASLPSHQRRAGLRYWLWPWLIHSGLLIANISISIAAARLTISSRSHGPGLIYSPAREAVRLERHEYKDPSLLSTYVGKPSPELDQAWHVLLQYSNIRISANEMALIDPGRAERSIALPDGGYFGTITAIHELHCLKRLHQFMYPDYYFANISSQEAEDNRWHNEHCIDIIRQSIMCHADISPVTMRWGSEQRIPLGNFSSPHECSNWDMIEGWAKERQIPRLMEPGWLKHPLFGAVYQEGFENRIGQVHDN